MRKGRVRFYIIAFVLVAVTTLLAYYFFSPNNRVAPAFDEDKLKLVIEGDMISSKEQAKIVDEEILLPFDIIKEYFDHDINWDDKAKNVSVTTKDKLIRMKTENLQALVNNKPVALKIPVTVENNTVYVPIGFLSDLYNIDVSYKETSKVVVIDRRNSIKKVAEPISADAVIRNGRSPRFPIIKKLDMNAKNSEEKTLRVFDEYEKWYKVRTWDGTIGYIEKKFIVIRNLSVEKLQMEYSSENSWRPEKGKINMTWDMMFSKRSASSYNEKKIEGLDVVSPTWFQVTNDKGTLIDRGDKRYTEWAHNNGYKVWALFSNDAKEPAMTHRLLQSSEARDNMIRQILVFSSLYKLDGINVDFENINMEDKDALTQFIRELTPLLREQGLVVSVAVSPMDGSANWSLCYDREAIGKVVDYVALMAYDQNWPDMGPNAQIEWVEKSLEKVLKLVPREKLLLGIPFYSRLWKEETDKNGKVKATSIKSLSIQAAMETVKENKATVTWDEKGGQFYAEYKKDNAMYKLWFEDKKSIDLKSALVQKYRLAGAAIWSKNFSSEEVWPVLNKNLKLIDNYQDWKAIK